MSCSIEGKNMFCRRNERQHAAIFTLVGMDLGRMVESVSHMAHIITPNASMATKDHE